MTHQAEKRVLVLTPTQKNKRPVNARGILIAPSEWMRKVENIRVPGFGSLSGLFDTIAIVHSQPDESYPSSHDVILQTDELYSPHGILLAVSEELHFGYNTFEDSVINGIEVERAYYNYDLLPDSKMINEQIVKSPTTLEGFLGLINWHASPIKKKF